jgi:hypothetical protein
LFTGFTLVEALNDEIFLDWLMGIFPEKFKKSTYYLSAQIEYMLNRESYSEIKDTLIRWHQSNLIIREQELIGIARKTKPANFEQLFDLLLSLVEAGVRVPGKAITSICERFSTRNDENSILKFVSAFSENVGSDIAYSELQLILIYLRQDRVSDARDRAELILKRNIDSELRKHIQKVFADTADPRISDILDALKFEFVNTLPQAQRISYKRSASAVIRSRDIVRDLKTIYDDLCQVCRIPLETPFGRISEAAHIQGLGYPHNGPDEIGNLICLCPNHHKLFDSSSFYITDELNIVSTLTGEIAGSLYVSSDHEIDADCIKYQRGYAVSSSAKKQRKWNSA